jgi:hypothetical protein
MTATGRSVITDWRCALGIGDDILATGMAKGALVRGKRIAFGDGTVQKWGPHSEMIFRGNPNICPRGQERDPRTEWVNYYKGHRIYNSQGAGRWNFNLAFKAKAGEIYFDEAEERWLKEECEDIGNNLILLEPNVPNKPCGPNKQWPIERWAALRGALRQRGFMVCQFEYGRPNIVAAQIRTPTFRHAAALLKRACVAVLPEGGLHHAAAAVGIPTVVLFGGFVPPSVLGYEGHVNLTGGATACGSFNRCSHCVTAMASIPVDTVVAAVEALVRR